jgi:FkbM family methyltransferase
MVLQRHDSYDKTSKPAAAAAAITATATRSNNRCVLAGRSLFGLLIVGLSLSQAIRIVYQVWSPPSTLSSRPWREQPILSRRGVALEIPSINRQTAVKLAHDKVTLLVPNAATKIPEMSASLRYVLEMLQLATQCVANPEWLVVEVGALHGDFGLSVALSTGCRTIVYEAQEPYAIRIAQSLLLPENQGIHADQQSSSLANLASLVKVRHAAVSTKPWVTFAAAAANAAAPTTARGSSARTTTTESTKPAKIATEQLDKEFAKDTILLLKVDVEGGEDDALATATRLFAEQRIHHVILEYTPYHFAGRGTDYATLLSRFWSATDATSCYVLHHTQPLLYRIMLPDIDKFYTALHQAQIQTNLYCCLIHTDVFLTTATVWNEKTPLDD